MRREVQGLQDHSLKDSLQKSCKAMEASVAAMRQRLSKLKEQIIDGCRHILTDFKERGAVALNGITQFLHPVGAGGCSGGGGKRDAGQ